MKNGAIPASALAALALLLCAQCQRQDAALPGPTLVAVDRAVAVAAPAPVQPPVVAPAAPAADPDKPPPALGTWLDGNIYRFRLEQIRPCPSPAADGSERLAVLVRVTSKIDQLLVAPRDFKLEAGGVILDSAVVQKAPPGCGPLLTPSSVRAGKAADGTVVFDLPPGFNPQHQPVRLAYQPTRWGGAKRVETVLPSGSLPR